MKIEYVVPCRGIEQLVDGTQIAFGIETNAQVTSVVPLTVATYLLICITQTHNEEPVGELRIIVLNPSLEPCTDERKVPIVLDRSSLMPEGWSTRTLIPIHMVFEVDTYGGYSIELAAGGSSW